MMVILVQQSLEKQSRSWDYWTACSMVSLCDESDCIDIEKVESLEQARTDTTYTPAAWHEER